MYLRISLLFAISCVGFQSIASASDTSIVAGGYEIKTALSLVDKMRNQIGERTSSLRDSTTAIVDTDNWNVWNQLLYGQGKQDATTGENAYSSNTAAFHLGMDTLLQKQYPIGASFSYAHSSTDLNGCNRCNEINSLQAMLYSGWFNQRYFVEGNINLGRNSTRSGSFSVVAEHEDMKRIKTEYRSMQAGIQLVMGLKMKIDTITFEPKVTYSYQWIQSDYQDTLTNVTHRSKSYSTEQIGVGYYLFSNHQILEANYTPSLSIMLYKDLNTDDTYQQKGPVEMNSAKGASADLGEKVGGDILEIRLSNGLQLANNFSITAGLNFSQQENFSELTAGISTAKQF